ncbi:hypothetical protein TRV_06498, partial [Trichophyton verrucosum HKI 0517]
CAAGGREWPAGERETRRDEMRLTARREKESEPMEEGEEEEGCDEGEKSPVEWEPTEESINEKKRERERNYPDPDPDPAGLAGPPLPPSPPCGRIFKPEWTAREMRHEMKVLSKKLKVKHPGERLSDGGIRVVWAGMAREDKELSGFEEKVMFDASRCPLSFLFFSFLLFVSGRQQTSRQVSE